MPADEASPLQIRQVLNNAHKALKANPRDAELHQMLATLYEQLERYQEAVPHLTFLASAAYADEAVYARLIKALQRSGELAKAQKTVEEGLKRFPASPVLWNRCAKTHLLMSDFRAAQEAYAKLYALDPSNRNAVGMSGALKLLLTDMREGFDEYALRPMDAKLARFFEAMAPWRGEPLAGKKIVLWSEQGIGDVVMFLGLLPWLLSQQADVSLVVTARLAPLAARSFPGVTVIAENGLKKMGAFDYHLPLGELLRFALPHYAPAEHPPYLRADAEKTQRLRRAYLDYANARGKTRLVGLSWHTTNAEVGFTRTISLAELQPLLALPGVQCVSLQYGDHAQAIAECNRRTRDALYHDASIDALGDIDGLAAQMAAMDEIVTIDNTSVHMAGALGVPTTLLLSTVPDWRWGLNHATCRWYRQLRLERQEVLGKWQPVIKRVRAGLDAKS